MGTFHRRISDTAKLVGGRERGAWGPCPAQPRCLAPADCYGRPTHPAHAHTRRTHQESSGTRLRLPLPTATQGLRTYGTFIPLDERPTTEAAPAVERWPPPPPQSTPRSARHPLDLRTGPGGQVRTGRTGDSPVLSSCHELQSGCRQHGAGQVDLGPRAGELAAATKGREGSLSSL